MNTAPNHATEAAADQFARRIAARMAQGTDDLPYDITERLRAARVQALAKRKVVAPVRKAAPAPVVLRSGSSAILGRGGDGGWWNAMVSAIPLMALVIGLVLCSLGLPHWAINSSTMSNRRDKRQEYQSEEKRDKR